MQRFFKYVPAETAGVVLEKKTLRWSAPDLFNDPFEFKSPFELSFEWEDAEQPFYDEFSRIVTQDVDPPLAAAAADILVEVRARLRGSEPAAIISAIRPFYPSLLEQWKKGAEQGQQAWEQWKREYRVLCLSAVPNSILMWSHYAGNHQGVVLGFKPKLELDSAFLAARPVFYSREVPTAGNLAEFIKFVTGQWPWPNRESFEKSVFTKNVNWAYENEWRILNKETSAGPELYSDWPFSPKELVEIYFGCRTPSAAKDEIVAKAKALGTPISFFEMRDERIRFELTPVCLDI